MNFRCSTFRVSRVKSFSFDYIVVILLKVLRFRKSDGFIHLLLFSPFSDEGGKFIVTIFIRLRSHSHRVESQLVAGKSKLTEAKLSATQKFSQPFTRNCLSTGASSVSVLVAVAVNLF